MVVYGPLKVEGVENVPRKGGLFISANHISDADPLAIGAATPRELHYMAKEELFSIPVMGTLMRWANAFPVKPRSADRAALRKAEGLVQSGKAVVIFPEGQSSETGEMQSFLPGVALLAKKAGVPIVPAGIIGTRRIIPYGSVIPRPAFQRVIVRFGKPLVFSKDEDTKEILERLRQAVAELIK